MNPLALVTGNMYAIFDKPSYLMLLIPAFLILFYLIKKDFVVIKDESGKRVKRSGTKFFMFVSRFIIFALLIMALASPYIQKEKTTKGDPFVKILVDNSTSFSIFDSGVGERIKNELKRYMKVDLTLIGSDKRSNLGDGILEHMHAGESILLISDGYNNFGTELGDAALYASRLNTSINALHLQVRKDDYSIAVDGPSKVTTGVDNLFTVTVRGTKKDENHHVVVYLDGEVVADRLTKDPVTFSESFAAGFHKIRAELRDDDYFHENNVFYKTVKVVDKPKILLVTEKESPLKILLDQLYDVDVSPTVPDVLDPYYAIIINDIMRDKIDEKTTALSDFVSNGNGLVVYGGKSSYDTGNYKNSLFETILPVYVAKPGKKEGDVNIVIVIDISGSSGTSYGKGSALDVAKALAVDVMNNIKLTTRIGVVAFDTEGRIVSRVTALGEKDRAELESRIRKLQAGGGTLISSGLNRAMEALSGLGGGSNIVLISDGKTQGRDTALNIASEAAAQGIKIFSIGVGEQTDEPMMKQIAEIGNGIYFKASESNNIRILFGESEEEKTKGFVGTFVLDKNHFITENIEVTAKLSGYNQVVPRSTAKMLVITTSGDPLVSVWRLGLGRVVSVATDDGSDYAGELLNKGNSVLVSRMMNWAIGDPERKKKSFVDIQDTRLHEETEILYKGDLPPVAQDVVFYKKDEGLYAGTFVPQDIGFQTMMDNLFAVNYEAEYSGVGVSDELGSVVATTGGAFFKEHDIQTMVEVLRSQAVRTSFQKWYYRWPLLLAALCLFLLEVCIRRLIRYQSKF